MTIKEFAEAVEFNLRHGLRHAILGLGAPGVGKSQVIRQLGERYGMKVIDIRLAQMSEVEIGGLIYPNESRTKTVWLSPDILPNEERDGKNTILLLDEITSCPKRVQVAAYQLILDRRIGQYRLPEGCFVIALGNREDDDGVYIRLAGPLADRFEIHYIEPDFRTWKEDFAIPHGIHPLVLDYLTFKPAALHTQDPDSGVMVFATPRSWERVSDILKLDADLSRRAVRNKIIGNVGEAEGLQFIEFCRRRSTAVRPRDYIEGRAEAPGDPAEANILIAGIAQEADFLTPQTRTLSPGDRRRLETLIRSCVRLPSAEQAVLGLRALLEKNRTLVKDVFARMDDPAVSSFVEKNRFLLGEKPDGSLTEAARKNRMALE